MAASVWSGYLTFGLISMPVRLFSGARSSGISFHMLHRDDNTRVKQQLICPAENKVVERSEIVKGYEYRKGEYVIIEPEEIKKIEPKTAKAMEILEFVKSDEVDPVFFESSYYLVPEEAGRRPYALLTKALEQTQYVAIAKLTMTRDLPGFDNAVIGLGAGLFFVEQYMNYVRTDEEEYLHSVPYQQCG